LRTRYLTSIFAIAIVALFVSGCGSKTGEKPSSSQYSEQYDKVKESVKSILGDDYDAENFRETTEEFTNEAKNRFKVEFVFDLNKPLTILGMKIADKDLPGTLIFEKKNGVWECVGNSGDMANLSRMFK
jgi:hypothetical protein